MNNRSETRITGDHVEIEFDSVRNFFEERGRKFDAAHPYVSVLYQDHDVALAERRDAHEKRVIKGRLRLGSSSRILDIGCGVGRWADAMADDIAHYVGADLSSTLIEQARRRAPKRSEFHVLAATDLSLQALGQQLPFDRVIIAGLLLYMNDHDVYSLLSRLPDLCSDTCRIYLREPLALGERLTLKKHWSNELSAEYNAIYRSRTEFEELLAACLGPSGFRPTALNELFADPSFNNRQETSQFYCFVDRGEP